MRFFADILRHDANGKKVIEVLRKKVYTLRKERYANCKVVGDDYSEKL